MNPFYLFQTAGGASLLQDPNVLQIVAGLLIIANIVVGALAFVWRTEAQTKITRVQSEAQQSIKQLEIEAEESKSRGVNNQQQLNIMQQILTRMSDSDRATADERRQWHETIERSLDTQERFSEDLQAARVAIDRNTEFVANNTLAVAGARAASDAAKTAIDSLMQKAEQAEQKLSEISAYMHENGTTWKRVEPLLNEVKALLEEIKAAPSVEAAPSGVSAPETKGEP